MSDSNDKKPSKIVKTTDDQKVSLSRRNFTKASLMASPILMTAMSKPVWATTGRRCTASVLMSGDGSVPIDFTTCRSCSPGYWQHPNSCWSTAGMQSARESLITFGDFFVSGFDEDFYYKDELAALNTPLKDLFPSPPVNNKFTRFARAATASYLNAMAIGHLFAGNIPNDAEITSIIDAIFIRFEKPSKKKHEKLRNQADAKKDYFESFYDKTSGECILSNNGKGCPEQGFQTNIYD